MTQWNLPIRVMTPEKTAETTMLFDDKKTFDHQMAPWLGEGTWTERVAVRYQGAIRDMIVDENGIAKQLEPNHEASMLAGRPIVGPAVLFLTRRVWL